MGVMAFSFSDSEMRGIYLKSVKSPAISSKFRMVHRSVHHINVFSQVSRVDASRNGLYRVVSELTSTK